MIAFSRFELILYRIFGGIFVAIVFGSVLTGQTANSQPILFAVVPTFYLFLSTLILMGISSLVRRVFSLPDEVDHITALCHLAMIVVLTAIAMSTVFGLK